MLKEPQISSSSCQRQLLRSRLKSRTGLLNHFATFSACIRKTVALLACTFIFSFSASASQTDGLSAHIEPAELVDFSLADTLGKLHQLSAHRGNWVLVNFWATWCGPCVREMPALQRLDDAHDDLTVIGINFEEIDTPTLNTAIDKLALRYLVVRSSEEPILPFEPLIGLPSTFFVSPEGFLVYRHTGELSEAELETTFDEVRKRHANR